MTTPEEMLVDKIFAAADLDSDPDRDTIWVMGLTFISDVLLRSDQLTQERLIRGLVPEIRNALTAIKAIQHGSGGQPYPSVDPSKLN
jgi:hypothetical protein